MITTPQKITFGEMRAPTGLTLRLTGVCDYNVFEDGQRIGRIRFARDRNPGVWLWKSKSISPARRSAARPDLDEAKRHFRANWLREHEAQALLVAYRAMNLRNEP